MTSNLHGIVATMVSRDGHRRGLERLPSRVPAALLGARQVGKTTLAREIKRTSAPTLTRSMRSAMEDLELSRLDEIHAGDHGFPLARRVHAVAGTRILDDLRV